jgi:hypothetical protein
MREKELIMISLALTMPLAKPDFTNGAVVDDHDALTAYCLSSC